MAATKSRSSAILTLVLPFLSHPSGIILSAAGNESKMLRLKAVLELQSFSFNDGIECENFTASLDNKSVQIESFVTFQNEITFKTCLIETKKRQQNCLREIGYR